MSRRIFIALVFCLGLLSAAMPTLACAMQNDVECCDSSQSMICKESSGDRLSDKGPDLVCCTTVAPTTVDVARRDAIRGASLDDRPALLPFTFGVAPHRLIDYRPPAVFIANVPFAGSTTYLKTGRLRL